MQKLLYLLFKLSTVSNIELRDILTAFKANLFFVFISFKFISKSFDFMSLYLKFGIIYFLFNSINFWHNISGLEVMQPTFFLLLAHFSCNSVFQQ